MSTMLKTDAELLQCSLRVDSTQFPKALSNRIAQGYGKIIHTYIMHLIITTIDTIYKYSKYNIYFCPKINFK